MKAVDEKGGAEDFRLFSFKKREENNRLKCVPPWFRLLFDEQEMRRTNRTIHTYRECLQFRISKFCLLHRLDCVFILKEKKSNSKKKKLLK